MKKTKFYLFVLLLILLPKTSFGLIEVDITRGNLNPLPIAVSPLFVESKSVKDFQNLLKKDNIEIRPKKKLKYLSCIFNINLN